MSGVSQNNELFVRTLADLKLISSVRSGQVLYIKDRSIGPKTPFGTLWRKYILKDESGEETAKFITRTITIAFRIINDFRKMGKDYERYVFHLLQHVRNVKVSLSEYKLTYKNKFSIDASFDAISLLIDHSLESIEVK